MDDNLSKALYRRKEIFSHELWDEVDAIEVLSEMMGYTTHFVASVFSSEDHIHYFRDGNIVYTLVLCKRIAFIKGEALSLTELVHSMSDSDVGFEQSLLGCIRRLAKKL